MEHEGLPEVIRLSVKTLATYNSILNPFNAS